MSPTGSSSRNDIIDSFRAFAVLSVMAFHYLGTQGDYGYTETYSDLWAIGRHGVDVFFVISGLVISMSVTRAASAQVFLLKRFARLFPAFLVCSFITFWFTRIIGPQALAVSWADYLLSFTLLAKKLGFKFTDGVYWTLLIEVEFYLLVAASFAIWGRNFWIGIVIAALFGLFGKYMGFFLLGSGVHFLFIEKNRIGGICLGLGGLIAYVLYGIHLDIADNIYLVGSIASLLIMTVKLPNVKTGALAYIGRISYPLYLLHQNVGVGIIQTCKRAHISNALTLTLAAGSCVSLAALIHHAVETPMQSTILNWINVRRGKRSSGIPFSVVHELLENAEVNENKVVQELK